MLVCKTILGHIAVLAKMLNTYSLSMTVKRLQPIADSFTLTCDALVQDRPRDNSAPTMNMKTDTPDLSVAND